AELDGATVVVVVAVAAVAALLLWPEKARAASAEKAPVRARPPARTARVRPEMRRRPASRAAVRSFMGCSLGRPTGNTLRGSSERAVNDWLPRLWSIGRYLHSGLTANPQRRCRAGCEP